jgi:hypothetical protein
VVTAYAEAGIEFQVLPGGPVPQIEEGLDKKWNDAELENSMHLHFSQFKDVPQWKVWELVAEEYVQSGVLGIMFDYTDQFQRQGCAVFEKLMFGTQPSQLRQQLFAYVHELGHCFNLLHSFQKQYANPPQPYRPNALSWMNYPQLYSDGMGHPGSAAFWQAFPFQFDDLELIHVRHAFRNDIIMGGKPFGTGAALKDQNGFADPVQDNAGLNLEISVHKPTRSFLFGEPVVITVKLNATEVKGKTVHPYLRPETGLLQIGICDPNGNIKLFRPLIDKCVIGQELRLEAMTQPIEDSVYCGFGKDGFYFDRTGFYQLRAVYLAPDGSKVVSNVLHLRVRHPVTAVDEAVADLFLGTDQGKLLTMMGSDAEHLKHGNDAFDEVLNKHATHPLAEYVRFIRGVNAARVFKNMIPGAETVRGRKPMGEAALKLLKPIEEAAAKQASMLDPLTIRENVLPSMANAHAAMGDAESAQKIRERVLAMKGKAVVAAKAA